MFPVNSLEILLRHDLPVVACNYSTRSVPLKGVAYTKIGDWDSWLGYNANGPKMSNVEGVGMGFMLVKSEVFYKMSKPWFEITYNENLGDHIGEDFYFCKKAIELGYEVTIDNVLSREIKHLGTSRFDLARTLR